MGTDHYETLGVSRQATPYEVRAAFLRLIRQAHPDTSDGASTREDAARIIIAYRCLRDPGARARYDSDQLRRRGELVIVDRVRGPAFRSSLNERVKRLLVAGALIGTVAGAVYLLSIPTDRPRPEAVAASVAEDARVREQRAIEARLDVHWVTTMHGRGMLAPLSRQCYGAETGTPSAAQCDYCQAFDEAAATAVPGESYFGDLPRQQRHAACRG